MSQYLEFFIRHKDTYLPIASFCGSSAYMEAFDGEVPSYSGLAPVDKKLVGYVQANAEKRIKDAKERIAHWEKEKEQILQASNSLEEKMEYINGMSWIEEYDDTIEEWTSVLHFTYFLYDILNEVEYAYHWEKDGQKVLSYEPGVTQVRDADLEKYLYVGIEPQMKRDITELTEEDKKDWI